MTGDPVGPQGSPDSETTTKGGHRAARFLRACRREPVDVTPIWLMRQAGRSLPEYRALREHHSFLDLMADAELCAEVTLMPFKHAALDAAIMFADIMTPVAALGIDYQIVEGVGPVVADPLSTTARIESISPAPAAESVPELMRAIKLVRGEIDSTVPLIGFSGAPFTLASYLIEGRPVRDFSKTKALMQEDPELWSKLMDRLVAVLVDYLQQQVASGVQAFQIFDSWVGELSPGQYEKYVLPYSRSIFDETKSLDVPRIHFGTGTSSLLELMAEAGPEVIGVDWRLNLDDAWRRIGQDRGVQGNLDPQVLLGSAQEVRAGAQAVLAAAGGRPGHVFNLGHGVLPDTPLDNIKLLVDIVHEQRAGTEFRS